MTVINQLSSPKIGLQQRLLAFTLYLVPHHLLAALMHRLACAEWQPLKALLIHHFARRFAIDLTDAAEQDQAAYPNFNAFFTRALRPDARPLHPDPDALLSPADGTLSEYGRIIAGRLYQAKGHDFALLDLLGGAAPLAAQLADGAFATIYLAPRDYHRVHMPLAGTLRMMRHVPGRLFSVNPASTRLIPGLFARNERVISVFDTAVGPLVVILVGAFFVGSITTVWAGQVCPLRHRDSGAWDCGQDGLTVQLGRGAEMGRFNMGSTVILLLPKGAVSWVSELAPGTRLRVGERIGVLRRASVA